MLEQEFKDIEKELISLKIYIYIYIYIYFKSKSTKKASFMFSFGYSQKKWRKRNQTVMNCIIYMLNYFAEV